MTRDADWWKKEVVYQVYLRSFFDSNGDGIGDLQGLISKLDYIKETGFTALWVSPFFESPQVDFGYDISNYDAVDAAYGTEKDLDELIEASHKRGLKVILDMVLNHTSDQHLWFKESRSSLDNPKRDWYIWRKPRMRWGKPHAPNNWTNHLNKSGWVYDEASGEYYFASFFSFQPDLNWRNPEVRQAMFAMMRRYLDKGVDGFRLDIIGALFKEKNFRDNPLSRQFTAKNYKGLFFRSFEMTRNRDEVFEFATEMRSFVDSFDHKPFLLGEVFGDAATVNKFLDASAHDSQVSQKSTGLHSVFYFSAAEVAFKASNFAATLQDLEDNFVFPRQASLAFSNHDRIRYLSKLKNSEPCYKIALLFQLTARALPVIYQGEEIGMQQARFSRKKSLDHVAMLYKKIPSFMFHLINRQFHGGLNRDNARTPFLWNTQVSAGFSTNETTWLPVHQESDDLASQQKNAHSLYHFVKKLLYLRQNTPSLSQGTLRLLKLQSPHVLAYEREWQGERIRVLLNFSRRLQALGNLGEGELLFLSDDKMPFAPQYLQAYQGVILRLFEQD